MKKQLLTVIALLLFTATNGQRYLSEIFSTVNVTSNIQYGSNISVFPPPNLTNIPLMMDIYEPAGDLATNRPLLIVMHTGSYLPRYINQQAVGSRNDSATVELCKRFARRGYVVVNMDYRLGWNPAGSNVDIRRGTLLMAVYRSIQDAKACVRFFRKNVAVGGNTWNIDPNLIILGGHGTGGYIALNYAILEDPTEITLPKYISGITDATYGFVAGQPYINQSLMGDYDGSGGIPQLNDTTNNSMGYPTDIQFVYNLGGAMGDSSWIEAGDAPMVAFHVVGDPFAPYNTGIVYVPGNPPQAVVDVSGSYHTIQLANGLGNNNCFINAGFTDPYTLAANQNNNGLDGLYPFVTNPAVQSGPWEWFDSLTVVAGAAAVGQNGSAIYANALLTNPDMSKAKALAYIDTVMNYLNPRIVYCLNLNTGINNPGNTGEIKFFPNPANNIVTVKSTFAEPISRIEILNIAGEKIKQVENINLFEYSFNKNLLAKGMYFINISAGNQTVCEKLIIQ